MYNLRHDMQETGEKHVLVQQLVCVHWKAMW